MSVSRFLVQRRRLRRRRRRVYPFTFICNLSYLFKFYRTVKKHAGPPTAATESRPRFCRLQGAAQTVHSIGTSYMVLIYV